MKRLAFCLFIGTLSLQYAYLFGQEQADQRCTENLDGAKRVGNASQRVVPPTDGTIARISHRGGDESLGKRLRTPTRHLGLASH